VAWGLRPDRAEDIGPRRTQSWSLLGRRRTSPISSRDSGPRLSRTCLKSTWS
jgi:hypothetical protein